MSAASPNLSVCREDALNALVEIRACHDELRTFLADTFDRLDEVVGRLRRQEPASARVARHADPDVMQGQIDHLTRLVSELAHTVKKQE
jgi:hypothetical protein